MKRLILFAIVGTVLASCSSRTGHLTGTLGRVPYHPQIPMGMVYIPAGGYQMGENDGDMPFLHQTRAKRFPFRHSTLIKLKFRTMSTVNSLIG